MTLWGEIKAREAPFDIKVIKLAGNVEFEERYNKGQFLHLEVKRFQFPLKLNYCYRVNYRYVGQYLEIYLVKPLGKKFDE